MYILALLQLFCKNHTEGITDKGQVTTVYTHTVDSNLSLETRSHNASHQVTTTCHSHPYVGQDGSGRYY